jgi:predicted dehydrogenase
MVAQLSNSKNVEMTAVCDLWTANRDRAVAANKKYYGRAPRSTRHAEELFHLEDIDAVLISTPEHSHSLLLNMTVEAGKDAYCEKPMGNVLAEVKVARDAVRASKRIVQVGTQHRSEPYQIEARSQILTGALGQISKYEIVWNYHGPRWRGRPEVEKLREQDTDWHAWLMNKPARPFDPQLYFEYRLYKDFSSGIADQWMSHGIDLCHYFMDEAFPESVVAHGGIFAWQDGRENPIASSCSNTQRLPCDYATSLAMMPQAIRASWGRMARSLTRVEKAVHAGSLSRKRGITKRTLTLTRRESSKIYSCREIRRSHPWESATRIYHI